MNKIIRNTFYANLNTCHQLRVYLIIIFNKSINVANEGIRTNNASILSIAIENPCASPGIINWISHLISFFPILSLKPGAKMLHNEKRVK